MYIGIANLKKTKPRKPSDVHIRIGNPNVQNQWLPGFSFSRLAIRICISDVSWRKFSQIGNANAHIRWLPGFLFLNWQSESAYPMASWGRLFSIGNPSVCAYPMVSWVKFSQNGNPNVHMRCFLAFVFLDWESKCAYPMASWVEFFRMAIRLCTSGLCLAWQDWQPR